MQYTSDPEVMRNDIDVWESFLTFSGIEPVDRPMSKIYLGLGWMDEPTSFPDSAFNATAMVQHVRYGQSRGVGGYTIFRMGIPGMDDGPLVDALTVPGETNGMSPPFALEADPPFRRTDGRCETPPGSIDDVGSPAAAPSDQRFPSPSPTTALPSESLLEGAPDWLVNSSGARPGMIPLADPQSILSLSSPPQLLALLLLSGILLR